MLSPKKNKFNKHFKNSVKGTTFRGHKIIYGTFALKTLQETRLTAKQIEAGRRVIVRQMKRLGCLWVRIFPHTPVTSKPTEVRMGKGKGAFDFWASKIQKGQIIYEMSGISEDAAIKIFKAGSKKLPIKTKFISKKGL